MKIKSQISVRQVLDEIKHGLDNAMSLSNLDRPCKAMDTVAIGLIVMRCLAKVSPGWMTGLSLINDRAFHKKAEEIYDTHQHKGTRQ